MFKTKIVRARSSNEYVSLIEQALDDIWDIRQSIEFDGEGIVEMGTFINELEITLKEIYQSMKDGTYEFATGDFPFMAALDNYHASMLPFRFLLVRINETHMKGLEISKED
ncbi:MAG: general secretion pathway protein GspF [Gammaproteobacteria bacterium]|nr:general secretion pathway protein GspF [Gammaproteobacteria bacterium]